MEQLIAAQIKLDNAIYLDVPPSYSIQLYVLASLVAICFLFNMIALVARWRRGSFWLYRLVDTRYGTFIVPHSVVTYLIFNSLFSVFFEMYIKTSLEATRVGSNLYNAVLWRSSIWFPLVRHAAWLQVAVDENLRSEIDVCSFCSGSRRII